jgi:hypothetical protein
MPQQAWTATREREYHRNKGGRLLARGHREDQAEEIAARTVNKDRAWVEEGRTRSLSSTDDQSSSR